MTCLIVEHFDMARCIAAGRTDFIEIVGLWDHVQASQIGYAQ